MNNTQHNNLDTEATRNLNVPASIADKLEAVKRQVFEEFQSLLGANEPLLRMALIEADALARQTEYPHLIFPLLAAEKACKAARWQFHQQFLLRSGEALSA